MAAQSRGDSRVRDVLIMVTLPSEAADDHRLVSDLVRSGMDVARINCAHDDAGVWTAMAEQVRRAASEVGRPCRVCMDICGPRARTRAVDPPDDRRVQVGERLLMRADATIRAEGEYAARFQLSIPEPVAQVAVGDSVWINEGKLGALVERREPEGVVLRVTRTSSKGAHLRDDKGVNFPDTELDVVPLAKSQSSPNGNAIRCPRCRRSVAIFSSARSPFCFVVAMNRP